MTEITARSRACRRAEQRAPSPRWGCSHGVVPAAPRVLRVCALTPARRLEGGKAAAARPGPSRLRGRRGFEGRRGTPGSEKRRLPPVGREGRGDPERGRHALGGLALGGERLAAGRALPARPGRPGASHARSSSAGQHHPRPHGKDGGSEGGSAPRGEGTPPRGAQGGMSRARMPVLVRSAPRPTSPSGHFLPFAPCSDAARGRPGSAAGQTPPCILGKGPLPRSAVRATVTRWSRAGP